MRILNWLFKKKDHEIKKVEDETIEKPHHILLNYMQAKEDGFIDEDIEKMPLSALGFNSLHYGEMLFSFAKKKEIPIDRIVHHLEIGVPGKSDEKIALMLKRISMLAESGPEEEREFIFLTGMVGNPEEDIFQITDPRVTIDLTIRILYDMINLKNDTGHSAIDAEYDSVKQDHGW